MTSLKMAKKGGMTKWPRDPKMGESEGFKQFSSSFVVSFSKLTV